MDSPYSDPCTPYITPAHHSTHLLKGNPRIVALGGGHGLHNLLRGLKSYTKKLTAIVAVTDDGGSSGILRKELGMPAPGDLRNCMQALSNVEPLMEQLMDYRFTEGSLRGQSFGNLFLAALYGITPSFDQAVSSMQKVLAITGQVLPVTAENVKLGALLENGVRVVGESKIRTMKQSENYKIKKVFLSPQDPAPLPEALHAIHEADLILVGPGSLYTSLIPNLLVPEIAEAIRSTTVPRLYLANLMTEAGETDDYTIEDHISAIYDHGGPNLFTACLVNSAPIPESLAAEASKNNVYPLKFDRTSIEKLGVQLLEHPLLSTSSDHICHSPFQLVQFIREFYEAKAIKVFPDSSGRRYIIESD